MTVVEGDQKVPFSIATTQRSRGGRYSFPWIAPFYSWYIPLYCWVLSKEVWSTIFEVFGMTRPGLEPRSPGPLANTLPTRPMSLLLLVYQGYPNANIGPWWVVSLLNIFPTNQQPGSWKGHGRIWMQCIDKTKENLNNQDCQIGFLFLFGVRKFIWLIDWS